MFGITKELRIFSTRLVQSLLSRGGTARRSEKEASGSILRVHTKEAQSASEAEFCVILKVTILKLHDHHTSVFFSPAHKLFASKHMRVRLMKSTPR